MSSKRLDVELTGRRLLLDSNLMVLFSVGSANPDYIASHKRLAAFDGTDFQILKKLAAAAAEIVICPNTVTETYGLSRQIRGPAQREIAASLGIIVERAVEHFVSSRDAFSDPAYLWLGATDAALLTLLEAKRDIVLLTTDLQLFVTALQRECLAANFNAVRDMRGDFR